MRLPRILPLLLVLLAAPCASRADTVKIRVFTTENIPPRLWIKSGAEFVAIPSPLFAISEPVAVIQGEAVEFFVEQPDPAKPTGKPRKVLIGRGTLPAKSHKTLVALLATPAAEDGMKMRVLTFDDDDPAFTGGTIRVINLCDQPILAKLGSTQFQLPANGVNLVTPAIDHRNRVRVKAAVNVGSGQLIEDGVVLVSKDKKVTCVALYAQNGMAQWMSDVELAKGPPPPGFFWLTFSDVAPPPEKPGSVAP